MRLRKQCLGDKNIIGEKVAKERKDKGLSQKDFLAKLQIKGIELSASGLSKLEGQLRLVTDKELVAIAAALKVPTDKLLKQSKKRKKSVNNI